MESQRRNCQENLSRITQMKSDHQMAILPYPGSNKNRVSNAYPRRGGCGVDEGRGRLRRPMTSTRDCVSCSSRGEGSGAGKGGPSWSPAGVEWGNAFTQHKQDRPAAIKDFAGECDMYAIATTSYPHPGRGQAIAPPLPTKPLPGSSIVWAMACPRPWGGVGKCFHITRTGQASIISCRERSRKRSASIENDAIARHIGNESGIPFLQATRSEQDVHLAWRI